MNVPNDFEKSYFIQTRSEINTEKKERDQMLNFAVLVLGAVGFSIAQFEAARKYLQSNEGFGILVSALIIISSLFWIRHKKLRQIADRWYVLRRLIFYWYGSEKTSEMLEGLVYKNLPTSRYTIKDVVLNISLSSPIYWLLYQQFMSAQSIGENWRVFSTVGVLILHIVFSFLILGRKIKDPLPPVEKLNQNATQP